MSSSDDHNVVMLNEPQDNESNSASVEPPSEKDASMEESRSSPMLMNSSQPESEDDIQMLDSSSIGGNNDDPSIMSGSESGIQAQASSFADQGCSKSDKISSTEPKKKMNKAEREAERLRRLEQRKIQEENKQRRRAERERAAEEKKLEKQQKSEERKRQLEDQKREQEEKRKEKERQTEEKRKEREEKKRLEEEERAKKAEEKRKMDEEKIRKAEEKRKMEEEKLQKMEEQQKKQQIVKQKFMGFFHKHSPKSKQSPISSLDDGNQTSVNGAGGLFGTFQLQKGQQLASVVPKISRENFVMGAFDSMICHQDETILYLNELRCGSRKPYRRRRSQIKSGSEQDRQEEEIIVDNCDMQKKRYKAKLLQFCENNRPPYFGTWRSRSTIITGRKPFAKEVQRFDYDIDSDDEWEEEEKGESIKDSDSEKSDNEDNDYELDEFFVPHGHLSDDENQEEDIAEVEILPDGQKKRKLLTKEKILIEERTKKLKRLVPRAIGCLWMESDEFINKAKFRDFEKHRVVFMNEM